VAAFPEFIETIASKFEDFDYQIMVVDTSIGWGLYDCNSACPDILTCKNSDPCCPANNYPKNELCCGVADYPCAQLDLVGECDTTFGAGNVFAAGWSAANKPCKLDSDKRYITKDQSKLSETFSCIAQVGVTGGQRVGSALVNAVSPELNAPGGCNEGFLRDDALLMVTLVNDGWDYMSPGTPKDWYKAVVATKNDDPEAIVMFNIGIDPCPDGEEVCTMAQKFPYQHAVSIDVEDFSPAFDAATDLVEVACELLIPQ